MRARLARLCGPQLRLRVRPFPIAIPLAAVVMLVAPAAARADDLRVSVDQAAIWNGAGGVSAVLVRVAAGTVLEVRRRTGEWYEVIVPSELASGTRSGYISASQVVPEGPENRVSVRPERVATQTGTPPGGAQPLTNFMNVDGTVRFGGDDFTRHVVAFGDLYREDGSTAATYGRGSGWQVDALVGRSIWRQVGAAVGVSYSRGRDEATIVAQVPHPFMFERFREASTRTAPLAHAEIGMHVPALWIAPTRGPVRMMVFGGLSVFWVRREIVTDVTLAETYPYDEVGISDVTRQDRTHTAVGYHIGADVAHFWSRAVGLGGGIRYSHARIDPDDGATTTGDAGGLQVTAGFRTRF